MKVRIAMNLIEQAIQKIDSEAEKLCQSNSCIQTIAQYIIDNLIYNDSAAKEILCEDKTLKKCLDEIFKKAKNESHNKQFCCVRDEVVYMWTREYWNINLQSNATKNDNFISLLDMV